RRRRQRHDPRRAHPRRQQGDGFRQANADQRGDRSGRRHRERPHRQPQPAERGAQEIVRRRPAAARPNGSRAGPGSPGNEASGEQVMATRKKTAKVRSKTAARSKAAAKKTAAKKSSKKVVALKAGKPAAKAHNGNGLPRPSSKPWGQAGRAL